MRYGTAFKRFSLGSALALSASFASCSDDDTSSEQTSSFEVGEAAHTYAHIVLASYEDALDAAVALDNAVQEFVAEPSEERLTATREAWLAAREPYLQTEVYRFYDGPIDDPDTGVEGFVNAWPLDEAYIDYVEGDPSSGIVNDASQTIDAEALMGLNEQGGEENIATGFHALEFLLWGQDQSEDGPGARPFTDYTTADNAERRAQYLSVVSALLVTQLAELADAWAEGDDNYAAEFEAAASDEALRRMLTGMIVLSGFETGGERLQTALDSGDQEDEHSCFSDNTHRDMVQDVQGMWNVWQGSYERTDGTSVSGTGLREVVNAREPELADALDARIDESLSLAQALQPPFDREIRLTNPEGRARVEALITSLRDQADLLEEVFRSFGLTVPSTD